MAITQLKEKKRLLEAFIQICEPYEGKYWNRQNDKVQSDIAACAIACHDAGVGVQFRDYSESHSPKITLQGARSILNHITEDLEALNTLASDQRIVEWNDLMAALGKIEKSFRDSGEHNALATAKRLGLLKGLVSWN